MPRGKPKAPAIIAPAHLWVPDHVSTAGGAAADLMESAGLIPDAEQRLALDIILAERADGRWASFVAALIATRQWIKTFTFKAIALHDLYVLDTRLVVWTAHEFSTAMEAFRDLKEIIDGTPHFSRRVKKITEANGEEAIELINGQRLRFRARTKAGGRGLTGDRVILDEGFALRPPHMGSLMPTMAAKSQTGNPQIVIGSSAGMVQSDVLRDVRDRGRAGGDPTLAYIEWCVPEGSCDDDDCDHARNRIGCACDDMEKIRLGTPALEKRISIPYVRAERQNMTPEEYARERMGWWEDPVGDGDDVPLAEWRDCADDTAAPTEPLVYSVDIAPDHLWSSIVVCGGPVEVIEHGRGSSWLLERLCDLDNEHHPDALVLDPAGPVGSIIPDLEAAGWEIRTKENPDGTLVLLTATDVLRACGSIYTAVLERELVHRDQPVLNDAFIGAARRKVGDAWKWSRRDSDVCITPLVAATCARWVWAGINESKPARRPATANTAKPTRGGGDDIYRPRGGLRL